MIEVHHLNNSRSQRVLWALEELGLDYLVRRYGKGRLAPREDSPDYQRYVEWMHFAEGSAMLPLVMKLIFGRLETAPMPFFIRPVAKGIARKVRAGFIEPNIKSQLDYMEAELKKSTWFAGSEFTAADIQMSFPVEAAEARGGLDMTRPKLMNFIERIHSMPSYTRAIEKGGPFELMR